MKRIIKALGILIAFCVIISIIGFAPIFKHQVSGIENYSPADCSVELSLYLFPDESFLKQFEYVDGDYQYYFNGKLEGGYATAFCVLHYTPEVYDIAKEYCMQHFTLTDKHQYQVGDYHFIEHLCYDTKNAEGEYVISCLYPEIFNMFAYNDSIHTLVFIGYYEPNSNPKTQLALTDFEAFYEEHFAKYYELE